MTERLEITVALDGDVSYEDVDNVLLVYGLNLSRILERTLRDWLRKAHLPIDSVFCERVSVVTSEHD